MKWTLLVVAFSGLLSAQDQPSCPMHGQDAESAQHYADVEKRGDQAMGFDHEKTFHHFKLYADGGAIEVTANDPKDSSNIAMIRSHLRHIRTMFSDGNFSVPMLVHGQVPPGSAEMKQHHADISYEVEEIAAGGRVRIKSSNPEALKAVHDFLRFQIRDHRTGDSEASQ